MTVSYSKTRWAAGDIITAAKLNNIENGIFNISTATNNILNATNGINESITAINGTIEELNTKIDELSTALSNMDLDSVLATLNDAIAAIETNAANIATNQTNISTNADNITDNRNRIDELEENQLVARKGGRVAGRIFRQIDVHDLGGAVAVFDVFDLIVGLGDEAGRIKPERQEHNEIGNNTLQSRRHG